MTQVEVTGGLRLAAAVLVIRDSVDGIETLLLQRNSISDFAADALVFPGGRLDPGDRDPRLQALASGDCDGDELVYRIAAIRETFEESGILFARHRQSPELFLSLETYPFIEERRAINAGDLSLVDFLEAEQLSLADDLLVPFGHWITPVQSPVRYSTRFFLARWPQGQQALADGSENLDQHWLLGQRAIDDAYRGHHKLVFATEMNIARAIQSETVHQAIECAQHGELPTVLQTMLQEGDDWYLTIPEQAGYPISKWAMKGRC